MRKLVTIRNISSIQPIENADMIEAINVDGWSVVAQKGIHKENDSVLYFELDSFLPQSDVRFESFMKFGTNTFNGVVGHKVKTKRLRGVYSQGIILPVSLFPEIIDPQFEVDYAELLGIVKYERSEVTGNGGQPRGSLPWFIRKTDQERLQNIYNKISDEYCKKQFVGTMKMDGSSTTVFYVDGDKYDNRGLGFCSRNQELKIEQDVACMGKFQQGIVNSGLFEKVVKLHEIYGKYYAIQGELVGPGIQGNFEKFDTYKVFAFNILDIETQHYVDFNTFQSMCDCVDIQTVPVVYKSTNILVNPLKEIIKMSDGKGTNCSYREGIVWKQVDGDTQFKVISNIYLEKDIE
jgi:RNA ligase (TIGR02306 family)